MVFIPLRVQEERVILSPGREQEWLVRPKIVLEDRIERDVALVVAQQVQLYFVRAGSGQIEVVERIAVWRNRCHLRNTMCVLPARRLGSEEPAERLSVGRRRLSPLAVAWRAPSWTPRELL